MDDMNDAGAPVAPKRKRGRKKGSPKVAGSGRKRAVVREEDILNEAAGMLPDLLKFHYSIVMGEPQTVTGPTGRAYKKLPSLSERQESAAWIAKLADRKQPDPPPELTVDDLDTQQITDLRNAVRSAVGLRKSELAVDAGAKSVSLLDEGDFTVVDPLDGGEVQSLDPHGGHRLSNVEIEMRHTANAAAPDDSNFELGGGHRVIKERTAGDNKVVYRMLNEAGEFYRNAPSPEAARRIFFELTAVGQELAAKKRSGAAS